MSTSKPSAKKAATAEAKTGKEPVDAKADVKSETETAASTTTRAAIPAGQIDAGGPATTGTVAAVGDPQATADYRNHAAGNVAALASAQAEAMDDGTLPRSGAIMAHAPHPYRRAGLAFSPVPVRVELADLTDDQITALRADTVLNFRPVADD